MHRRKFIHTARYVLHKLFKHSPDGLWPRGWRARGSSRWPAQRAGLSDYDFSKSCNGRRPTPQQQSNLSAGLIASGKVQITWGEGSEAWGEGRGAAIGNANSR